MQALRCSSHSAVAACSISRGISAAAFTRDLLGFSRLLWRFCHTMSSKTTLSLLFRVLMSALPKANSRRWWRPESSSAATPELSWPLGQELSLLEDPVLTVEEGHVKMFHNSLQHCLLIHSDTSFTPFMQNWKCFTPWWDTSHQTMT